MSTYFYCTDDSDGMSRSCVVEHDIAHCKVCHQHHFAVAVEGKEIKSVKEHVLSIARDALPGGNVRVTRMRAFRGGFGDAVYLGSVQLKDGKLRVNHG